MGSKPTLIPFTHKKHGKAPVESPVPNRADKRRAAKAAPKPPKKGSS